VWEWGILVSAATAIVMAHGGSGGKGATWQDCVHGKDVLAVEADLFAETWHLFFRDSFPNVASHEFLSHNRRCAFASRHAPRSPYLSIDQRRV